MTQDAIVTRILDENMAEVVVTRGTACGANCGNCESCMFDSQLKTPAFNCIKAKPGDRVVIASKSSRVFSAAMLVYVMPLILFIAGYAIAAALSASEGLRIFFSFFGLAVGAVVLILTYKKWKEKNPITFDIVDYQEGSERV